MEPPGRRIPLPPHFPKGETGPSHIESGSKQDDSKSKSVVSKDDDDATAGTTQDCKSNNKNNNKFYRGIRRTPSAEEQKSKASSRKIRHKKGRGEKADNKDSFENSCQSRINTTRTAEPSSSSSSFGKFVRGLHRNPADLAKNGKAPHHNSNKDPFANNFDIDSSSTEPVTSSEKLVRGLQRNNPADLMKKDRTRERGGVPGAQAVNTSSGHGNANTKPERGLQRTPNELNTKLAKRDNYSSRTSQYQHHATLSQPQQQSPPPIVTSRGLRRTSEEFQTKQNVEPTILPVPTTGKKRGTLQLNMRPYQKKVDSSFNSKKKTTTTTTILALTNLFELSVDGPILGDNVDLVFQSLQNTTIRIEGNDRNDSSFPMEYFNQTNLQQLDLSFQQLTGPLPTELGLLTSLIDLDLQGNQFSGSIPSQLGLLTNLIGLSLHLSMLTGLIPSELGKLSLLALIDLSQNALSGSLPPQLMLLQNCTSGDFAFPNFCYPFHHLIMNHNLLSGSIPTQIGFLYKAISINLWQNKFSGMIPTELGSLENLAILWLDSNKLTGTIPSELGLLNGHPNLLITGNPHVLLGVSDNLLTGTVPEELVFSVANDTLKQLWINDNDLSGTLADSLCYLQDSKCHFFLVGDTDTQSPTRLPCHFSFNCTDSTLCGCDCGCSQ